MLFHGYFTQEENHVIPSQSGTRVWLRGNGKCIWRQAGYLSATDVRPSFRIFLNFFLQTKIPNALDVFLEIFK